VGRTAVPVFEEVDVGRTEEHVVEQVIVEEVIDSSFKEDVEHGNGQEAVEVHRDEQVDYDVEGIDNAYETQYHVESREDASTDDDDYFLVDEKNEIVEPDVDVHLVLTRMFLFTILV
nr:hypothetical protein [Tanacetum cinerariifolium]